MTKSFATRLICIFVAGLFLGMGNAEARGAGAVAQAVSARLASEQARRSAILAANRHAGRQAERAAADNMLSNGHRILGRQVSVRTGEGRRIIDYLIQSPKGRIVAIEVKSGQAVRGPGQLAKDRAMATEGGFLVGKNAPKHLRGKHMIIKTAERRHG